MQINVSGYLFVIQLGGQKLALLSIHVVPHALPLPKFSWSGKGWYLALAPLTNQHLLVDVAVRYPLAVKLGTITPNGADVYSYAPEEDSMVKVKCAQ